MASELQEIVGVIEQVSTKDGETNGKVWKKYGYKVAGSWYNGWGESEFGEGDDVIITYHTDRYGYAVNQVRDANATPVPKVERPMDMEPDKEVADAAEEKCRVNVGKPPEPKQPETSLTNPTVGKGGKSIFALTKVDRATMIQNASDTAQDLAQIIDKQKLFSMIGKNNPRKYVRVEGWQVLAAMLGCTCEVTSTLKSDFGYVAKAVVYNAEGKVLGSGEMQVNSDEKITRSDGSTMQRWSDEYMVRSMAQTRAIGKAYRNTFAWIMALAGYETTPAEEMKDSE